MQIKKVIALTALVALAWVSLDIEPAQAVIGLNHRVAQRRAARAPWHGHYNYTPYGRPTALVVPPTAGNHTEWGWGVGSTRHRPIYHQFDRGYPGPGGPAGSPYHTTPRWPSDTTQFGTYYIRGPW